MEESVSRYGSAQQEGVPVFIQNDDSRRRVEDARIKLYIAGICIDRDGETRIIEGFSSRERSRGAVVSVRIGKRNAVVVEVHGCAELYVRKLGKLSPVFLFPARTEVEPIRASLRREVDRLGKLRAFHAYRRSRAFGRSRHRDAREGNVPAAPFLARFDQNDQRIRFLGVDALSSLPFLPQCCLP